MKQYEKIARVLSARELGPCLLNLVSACCMMVNLTKKLSSLGPIAPHATDQFLTRFSEIFRRLTLKRVRQLILLLFPLLLFLALSTSGETKENTRSSFNAKSQKAITQNVLNQKISILPQLNKLNFGLGRHDGINFNFKKTLNNKIANE